MLQVNVFEVFNSTTLPTPVEIYYDTYTERDAMPKPEQMHNEFNFDVSGETAKASAIRAKAFINKCLRKGVQMEVFFEGELVFYFTGSKVLEAKKVLKELNF